MAEIQLHGPLLLGGETFVPQCCTSIGTECLPAADAWCPLADGCWLLGSGYWNTGYYILDTGYRIPLDAHNSPRVATSDRQWLVAISAKWSVTSRLRKVVSHIRVHQGRMCAKSQLHFADPSLWAAFTFRTCWPKGFLNIYWQTGNILTVENGWRSKCSHKMGKIRHRIRKDYENSLLIMDYPQL